MENKKSLFQRYSNINNKSLLSIYNDILLRPEEVDESFQSSPFYEQENLIAQCKQAIETQQSSFSKSMGLLTLTVALVTVVITTIFTIYNSITSLPITSENEYNNLILGILNEYTTGIYLLLVMLVIFTVTSTFLFIRDYFLTIKRGKLVFLLSHLESFKTRQYIKNP
ncbi:hypothetical protein [Alkalihalobacillus trypoxylicola]|uniref:Uncharacterized protein n=1 Tax=Alkalihalobacillus trypoxylicola TaxID=519424 RepID=A0A162F6K5_9BACI|nr:hypothetical protein [Alkalihalobacillus trypoxylicola]KYG34902.1 hypothetical protein AZF04_00795 [Alkalihalobacillus trypoxylicola]